MYTLVIRVVILHTSYIVYECKEMDLSMWRMRVEWIMSSLVNGMKSCMSIHSHLVNIKYLWLYKDSTQVSIDIRYLWMPLSSLKDE